MQREIDIFRYFPVLMQKIKQFQAVSEGENPEFRRLFESMEQTLNRAFIEESDEAGLRRWERALELPSNGDLDARRFCILARMNQKLPYTMTILKQQMELLCGPDGYSVELRPDEYTLQVKLIFLAIQKLAAVQEYLERIKPANILVKYGFWEPAIVIMEFEEFIARNFGVQTSFWNGFGSESILLNGSRKLDGSWSLDQSTKGIRFHGFGVRTVQNNCYTVSASLQTHNRFYLDGDFLLDGSRTLSGGITEEVL